VLDDDALEEDGSDSGVPDALGIDDDDRTAGADAEARSLAALDATRAEEKGFSLEKAGEILIQLAAAVIRRAEATRAYQHVAAIWIHHRSGLLGHHRHRGS
jgi:hypothetical protein